MKVLITGAGGFVGRALARRLLASDLPVMRLTLMDMHLPDVGADDRVRGVTSCIADPAVRARALDGGVGVVFHLAGVLSASSEADYALSRRVNLDASLSLFEEVAAASTRPRVVFSSSIAVLGDAFPSSVDDDTPPAPTLIYGAHKRMVEIALADFSRRGELDGISIRLSGILARPFGGTATKSSYLSDIFHAFARNEAFVSPVSREATSWVQSVNRCVDNLIHAATTMDTSILPVGRALTLPALRVTIPELARSLASATGNDVKVSYDPDPSIEKTFGRYPPLNTPLAERLGFRSDGDVDVLVKSVLASLG